MTQTTKPRLSSPARTNWLAWITLWVLAAGVVAALLANDARLDTHFWLATRWAMGDQGNYTWAAYHAANATAPDTSSATVAARPFYMDDPAPMNSHFFRDTAWLWNFFKFFGSAWPALIGALAIAAFARPRWLAGIHAAIAIALGNAPALVAFVFGRDRPNQHDGLNHWTLFRGFHEAKNLSFPSSHATAAFALAAVLAVYFPRTRWFMLPLAAACAFSRVVMEAHFYCDVLVGGVLGWTTGWFAARALRAVALRLTRATPAIV